MSVFDDHDNPKFRRDGRIADDGTEMQLTLDGGQISARPGDTVAAAMLASGAAWTKNAIDDTARAPFCMMGLCFECLVEIDGRPSQRACITQAREGMIVTRQRKAAEDQS
ncbi:MAG: (2Fe-2S)-binding protein [Pikeienuella sp.]